MAAHRVVIVGGGFGGLFAAKALRRAPVEVTLVDRHDAPPLPAAALPGRDRDPVRGLVAPPLRDILRRQRNAEVVLAEVVDVDLERRTVAVQPARPARRASPTTA